ncbi:MAG TPA: hypothetical protein VFZ25_01325 [Chloroflexota bacterium]|nr:hypothetical protein [Chloroflexota bacterium]
MKYRWYSVVVAATFLLSMLASPMAAGAGSAPNALPFRPVNPNYQAIKAAVDAKARAQDARDAADPLDSEAEDQTSNALAQAPTAVLKWKGLGPNGFSPSDARGAIGTSEYIETVNTGVGVYDRSGNLLSSNTQATWTGFPDAEGDADIVWDNDQQRFFASMLNIGSTYTLIFGFSKGSSPSAAASDWCFYSSDFGGRYGTNLPDYPKLGMTKDFLLVGVNVFRNAQTFIGSDVAWVVKPAKGTITTCPAGTSFTVGVHPNLKNADGTDATTPVPANLVDPSDIGYVVANEDPNGGTSTDLTLFTVTDVLGAAPIFSAPKTVTVPAYAYPPSAPQPGTTKTLDTLDGRLMNAVAAIDPTNNSGKVAVWTQHTVQASAGGKGSEVRWYEIDGATGNLVQKGIAQHPHQYTFMGAVSPDRNGMSGSFGGNMVLVFNTSSTKRVPTARMVSKVGGNAQSGYVKVKASTAVDNDFSCTPVCRWGDYSGATPDPASTTAGRVWASVMLSKSGSPGWTTENWAATP